MKKLIYSSNSTYDSRDTYNSIRMDYPLVATFTDDLYGQICSVYDQGNGRFALLNDQDKCVEEIREYGRYAEDPRWLHRYCRHIRDYKINGRLTAIEYTPEYQ